MAERTSPSRVQLWSACLGNLFEHYDTALFGFLSVFLAPLIFPEKEPITALILTYAMIPLGMLARPIGSLVFGYIGDTRGRKHALFLSLAGMAVVSGCIALSPTYVQAGALAPVIFCLGRLLQNFLSAGESMGGAIFLLENSAEKKHDLLSGLFSATTIAGILLASAGVTLLSHYKMVESAWRVLYLFGCITAIFGCMLRKQVREDFYHKNRIKFSQSLGALMKVFWLYRNPLLLIAITAGFSYACYSIALVLLNGFIPMISSLTKTEVMSINTSLLVLDFLALPFFGWLASKVSREKIMLTAAFGVAVCGIPLILLLEGATLMSVIGVRVCFVLLGVAFFAPFHAWAQKLVPPAHRYAVISFGYALGSQALGAPTAAISLWCFRETKMISSICWYWVALAMLSSLAVAGTMRVKGRVQGEVS